MAFDIKKHVIRVQGNREYLPVSARLVWFRQEHPDWSIVTAPVEINLEKQYAIFSATIMNAEGKIMATGTKMENIKGFGDFIEKSETGAVGRALAMCGFGTQFAPEMEEGGRFADAPQGPMSAGNRFQPRPNGTPNGNFGNRPGASRPNAPMNGNGNGDGNRPPMPMTVPPAEDENPFDSAATASPARQQANRPPAPERTEARPSMPSPQREPMTPQREAAPQREAVAPQREPAARSERPVPPAAKASGGIVRERVKEPEYTDPGGDDEPEGPDGLEGDDPFAEEFAAPAAAAPRAERPTEILDKLPPTQLGGNRPNPLASNPGCSSPGCTMKLTPAQVTMSMQKAGKPLCVIHLKEAMSGQSANPL